MIVIEGDCHEDLEADEGSLIHIYGNLNATIEVKGISEIIITGDLGPRRKSERMGSATFLSEGVSPADFTLLTR